MFNIYSRYTVRVTLADGLWFTHFVQAMDASDARQRAIVYAADHYTSAVVSTQIVAH
jgi:hypothetical protein